MVIHMKQRFLLSSTEIQISHVQQSWTNLQTNVSEINWLVQIKLMPSQLSTNNNKESFSSGRSISSDEEWFIKTTQHHNGINAM